MMDTEKVISEFIIRLERLESRVPELERENAFLKIENADLRERLGKYVNPKNSPVTVRYLHRRTVTCRRTTKAFVKVPEGIRAGSPAIKVIC